MRSLPAAALALLIAVPFASALPFLDTPDVTAALPCDALAPAGPVHGLVCGAFTALAPLPAPRAGLGLGWLPGPDVLLAYGGLDAQGAARGELFAFDPATGAWAQRATGPARAFAAFTPDHAAQAYVAGGLGPGGASAELWRYDWASDSWGLAQAGGGPSARYAWSAGWRQGAAGQAHTLYAFGGTDGAQAFGELWTWKPTDGWAKSTAAGPAPRAFGAGTWDPVRQGLAVQGGVAADGTLLKDSWLFNSVAVPAPVWERMADHDVARAHHVIAWDEAETNFVTFGGADAAGPTPATWVLAPAYDLWVQQASAAAAVRDAGAASTPAALVAGTPLFGSATIYLAGGSVGGVPTDQAWSFAPGAVTYPI